MAAVAKKRASNRTTGVSGIPRPKSIPEEIFALQIQAVGLPKPTRELRFHHTRKWRFDFAWSDHMVAFEIEGGIHRKQSRHTTPEGFTEDARKYNEATLLGWKVYRVTSQMVKLGEAVALLEKALNPLEDA